jgi:cytochrome b6-f complex iron-sulfur subunit
VIYKSESGFQAYSLVCTHLGCTLEEEGDIFSCPCHGSQFDSEGSMLTGPAEKNLPSMNVGISDDGNLVLETGEDWQ